MYFDVNGDRTFASTGGKDFDRSRVSVLLGVTGALEAVVPLGARLGHPVWRRALAVCRLVCVLRWQGRCGRRAVCLSVWPTL